MKDKRAQDIGRRLALDVEIVIENYRPGVLEKWDLGYEQLKAINPALIMVRLSGYGQTGPMRDAPGFGAIGESMGGIRYVSGHPDRPPVRIGISIGDSIASLHGAMGALMALRHRDVTGGRWNGQTGEACKAGHGQRVDVALSEAVFNMMNPLLPESYTAGVLLHRYGDSFPGYFLYNTYPSAHAQISLIDSNS